MRIADARVPLPATGKLHFWHSNSSDFHPSPDAPLNCFVVDDHAAFVRRPSARCWRGGISRFKVHSAGSCAGRWSSPASMTHLSCWWTSPGWATALRRRPPSSRYSPNPPRIIAVSMHQEETFDDARTMQLGARSYVNQGRASHELFDYHSCHHGRRTYHLAKTRAAFLRISPQPHPCAKIIKAFNRELEVLMRLARGKASNRWRKTSRSVLARWRPQHNLCRKTGLKSTVDLLRYLGLGLA